MTAVASHWQEATLGELIELHDHLRVPLSSAHRMTRKGKYPYYGASGVIDYIDDYIFDGPYLLISEDGENLNTRKTPIAFRASGKFWVNNHAHIVRGKPGIAHDRFLEYVIAIANISGLVTGAAQPKLSQANLKLLKIRMPDWGTQKAILQTLSAYDDLIENNTRRIKILEDMAQMIYREWFVNFRFPGHEKVRMVESEFGPIPEGWSVKRFDEVAIITMGLSPKGDTYNDDGTGSPLINGPVEFGDRFTKAVKWTTAPTKCCEKGDLIVCVRGSTTGRYVKSDGVYCVGRGVCAMSSPHQCFVDCLFADQLPTLLAQTSGSTFPSWTGPQLKSHPVKCPPTPLLNHFEQLIRPMSAAVASYSDAIHNLRTTRDLLLPKLISGEISVEAAEVAAEITEEVALHA